MIGDIYVASARMHPISNDRAPYQFYDYFERENLPKNNVWIGMASRNLETEDPSYAELEEELKEANSVTSTYRNTMKGKYDIAEAAIKGVERMGKSIQGKKRFQIFHKDEEKDNERQT